MANTNSPFGFWQRGGTGSSPTYEQTEQGNGGIDYNTLMAGLKCFTGLKLVGIDCLELAPHYDPTGVSAITMAKTLRELIILAHRRRR